MITAHPHFHSHTQRQLRVVRAPHHRQPLSNSMQPPQRFPVRLFGAPCEGCAVVGDATVEMLRPRSTIKKKFSIGLACGDDVSTETAFAESSLQSSLQQAVAHGQSALIMAIGSEQSGKSTAVRSDDGLAVLAVRETFAALGANSEGVTTNISVSSVLCAITPAQGETALMGKQPVRERLLDALADTDRQPAAGLNVREHADGLPHPTRFYAEALSEVEAADAADAEQLVREAVDRCAAEETRVPAPLRVHLLLTLTISQRRRAAAASDGEEGKEEGEEERTFQVSVIDVAGVPRPRAGGAGAGAGGRGGAGRGATSAKAGRVAPAPPPTAAAARWVRTRSSRHSTASSTRCKTSGRAATCRTATRS